MPFGDNGHNNKVHNADAEGENGDFFDESESLHSAGVDSDEQDITNDTNKDI